MVFETDNIIRFNIGDTVKIRDDFHGDECEIPEYFTDGMRERYGGNELTVCQTTSCRIFDIEDFEEVIPFFAKLGYCLDGYDRISLR